MIKWIGEHIWDFVSRFRNDIYMESIPDGTIASGKNLGLDSNNKVVKSSSPSGSIDLTSEVTGTLPVANGGTGATSLNNLITLSTHTTGDYVASLTAGSLIDLQNNTGEGATPTIDVDLSELTDMTESWTTAEDEFVVLDNGTQKRKLSSEIFGSNAFTSTTIGTTTNALTFDDTTVQLNTGTTFDGSAARTVSAKTAAVSSGGAALATGDQIYDFVNDNYQTALTFGIGNGNAMKFASDAGAADDDFLRIKGTDIEGLSADEVKTALSLSNVENTALSTYTGQSGALDNQYITNGAGYVTANTMGSGFTVSATTDSNATTITQGDDLFFAAGTGITCETTADGTVTITNTVTDTNTQLTTEQVQDIAGPLVATGGTKTLISVTYDDANNNMDFVVDNDLSNYDNSSSGFVTSDTNTQNSYAISCVDGDNSDEEKIRLTQSGAGGAATDDIVLEAGTGLSIARSSDKMTFTNTVSNTDTTYTAGTGLDLSGGNEFSVDVSDFMTNGSNDRIVTATGTDGMNAESNLSFNGSTLTVSGNVRAASISHAISGNNAGDYGRGAEILYGISNDSVTAGEIYVLRNGVWTLIDADAETTVNQIVGVATIAA